jgi:hypothetical protein
MTPIDPSALLEKLEKLTIFVVCFMDIILRFKQGPTPQTMLML